MASAHQCDKCKKFYNCNSVRQSFYIRQGNTSFADYLDLCDDCYSELEQFIGIGKKEKKDGNKKSSKNSKG